MPDPNASIDWVTLVMGLSGGLALFLIGMGQVTAALKALAGDRLRSTLARLSSNRVTGAATGAAVTAVIQSSSVTSVLVVGFVSANLLSLTQAASVIIGSHLGTTVTAQVIAFDVTAYALGMLGFGALLGAVAARDRWTQIGRTVAGLGFVFLGMGVMSESMAPLGRSPAVLDLLASDGSPVLALLAGAVFTALVQSSSATTGIVVVMAARGLVGLDTGIALVLGAAIGTCVTALLAAVGRSTDAVRAAVVHVLVNTAGALVALLLLDQLVAVVTWVSPADGDMASPRQIANASTVFHAVNTVVFLVLLTPVVRAAIRIVPDRAEREDEADVPLALDDAAVDTPVLALEGVRRELLHLGFRVRHMLDTSLVVVTSGSSLQLDDLEAEDDWVDRSHAQVVSYLGEVSRAPLGDSQRRELLGLLEVANELEQIADLVETNLVTTGRTRVAADVEVSPATAEILVDLHRVVIDAFDDSLAALGERDAEAAQRVIDSKTRFKDLEKVLRGHLTERLVAPEPRRVEAYTVEVEIIDALRRSHASCRRLARAARRSIIEAPRGKS